MADITTRTIKTRTVPEGPIAMPDGSIVLVEIARGTLTRVDPATGEAEVIAECGGGPNGAAAGPDGKIYVCNNGGYFSFLVNDGVTIPGPTPDTYQGGGSIQRVDPGTGEVETLYESCEGQRLVAPNDLVFDDHGGFWFTDHGVQRGHHSGNAGLLYATADGSTIVPVALGTDATNGVGLAPDGSRVYAAETHTGTVWAWDVTAPGEVAGDRTLLFDGPQGWLFDSLAVDGEGWVCVATIGNGGITCIAPDGLSVEHVPMPDFLVTNVCFAADGTAYVTCSSSGTLVAGTWPRPSLALPYLR